jgi:NADPH:quinone reductase-like Zn-dependent oxidoreductase
MRLKPHRCYCCPGNFPPHDPTATSDKWLCRCLSSCLSGRLPRCTTSPRFCTPRSLTLRWCDAVVRHGSDDVVSQVLAASGGAGVHYVVEMLADANLQRDLQMLVPFGHSAVAVVGSRGDTTVTPRLLMGRESSIHGVMLGASNDEDWAEASAYICAGCAAGTLLPLVGRVFRGLESAPAAHEEVIAHAGGAQGKIVLELD